MTAGRSAQGHGPRVLVVQPDPSDPLGRFGPWLADEGLAVSVVRPFDGDPVPDELEDDALIVLGGDMSALDDDDHPWLADIRTLYRSAIEASRPALGICLGAQLLAQSRGGRVTVGDRGLEAGVVQVELRPGAEHDPLVGGLPARFPAGAMHRDMIASLPNDAAWLGESGMYAHQVFRVGDSAWGVQFHPEISPACYRSWLSPLEDEDALSLARARQGLLDFESHDDVVVKSAAALARSFARLVRAAAARVPD